MLRHLEMSIASNFATNPSQFCIEFQWLVYVGLIFQYVRQHYGKFRKFNLMAMKCSDLICRCQNASCILHHIDVEAGFQSSKSTIAETGMGVGFTEKTSFWPQLLVGYITANGWLTTVSHMSMEETRIRGCLLTPLTKLHLPVHTFQPIKLRW